MGDVPEESALQVYLRCSDPRLRRKLCHFGGTIDFTVRVELARIKKFLLGFVAFRKVRPLAKVDESLA